MSVCTCVWRPQTVCKVDRLLLDIINLHLLACTLVLLDTTLVSPCIICKVYVFVETTFIRQCIFLLKMIKQFSFGFIIFL